jgi:hypothetical protein
VRSAALVLLVVGCSAPPRPRSAATAPVPAPASPPTQPAITEPTRPATRPDPTARPGLRERRIILEQDGRPRGWDRYTDVAESDLWDACVRDYVRAQPEAARRALTIAFSRFVTRCEPNGDFVVSPPYERRDRTHLGFEGRFLPAQSQREILLRVAICGPPMTEPTRIAIVGDRGRWVTPRFAFERQRNCDVALVPYAPSVGRALRDAMDAGEMIVRIEGGEPPAEDLIVTDEMKQDLRVMLDAIEALRAR